MPADDACCCGCCSWRGKVTECGCMPACEEPRPAAHAPGTGQACGAQRAGVSGEGPGQGGRSHFEQPAPTTQGRMAFLPALPSSSQHKKQQTRLIATSPPAAVLARTHARTTRTPPHKSLLARTHAYTTTAQACMHARAHTHARTQVHPQSTNAQAAAATPTLPLARLTRPHAVPWPQHILLPQLHAELQLQRQWVGGRGFQGFRALGNRFWGFSRDQRGSASCSCGGNGVGSRVSALQGFGTKVCWGLGTKQCGIAEL